MLFSLLQGITIQGCKNCKINIFLGVEGLKCKIGISFVTKEMECSGTWDTLQKVSILQYYIHRLIYIQKDSRYEDG